MARDWVSIAARIESFYPQAIGTVGGGTRDENLRKLLVPWFNDLQQYVDEMQRWSYNYLSGATDSTLTQVTTLDVSSYTLPAKVVLLKNVYYVDASGARVQLSKFEDSELSRVYGDPNSSLIPDGIPRRWSMNNRTVTLYPKPDFAGPTAGNYTIIYEAYCKTDQIVETTGTTTASSTTLTVPSTGYLTDLAVANGCNLAIRGAGYLGGSSVAATFVTTAATVATSSTQTTMGNAAITAVTSAQTFYNAIPWLVFWAPNVATYGVLRQVASYLQADTDYQKWEARFQNELEALRELDMDRDRTLEAFATAQPGQNDSQLRRSDLFEGYDYRGGTG